MNYRSYLLANRSQQYEDDVARHIAKMTKLLVVQLKFQVPYGSDKVAILSLLPFFQVLLDKIGTHGSAAMCLFHFAMKKTPVQRRL